MVDIDVILLTLTLQLYSLPKGETDDLTTLQGSQFTRFDLPPRCLSFSSSGRILAISGDDGQIKVMSMDTKSKEKKVFRTIPTSSSGHSEYVKGLTYDPEDSYLAVICADGTFSVYDVTDGKAKFTRRKCATWVDRTSPCKILPSWHPDGSLIAVPKHDGSVAVYEKLSWTVQYELRMEDGAESKMLVVAFSPNGLYIAAASEDKTIRVWSVNESDDVLCSHTFEDHVCNFVWHPDDNALVCITEGGDVALWNNVIPESTHVGPAVKVELDNPLEDDLLDDNDDVAEYGSDLDKDDSFIEHDNDSPGPVGGLARPKRKSVGGEVMYEKRMKNATRLFDVSQQASFQPGSTDPVQGRRYLAYNALGCIILRSEADHNIVEVSFHDTSLHRKRIPLLNDFYGFSIGSLGLAGALYASPSSEHAPSTVVFRPFDSWATNSEWTFGLPKTEEAVGVAVGDRFCIVGNNRRMIRIFSLSGLQVTVMSIPGDLVCTFAEGDIFGVVYHSGTPTAGGDQNLEMKTYSFSSGQVVMECRLSLSSSAHLAWIGFTDENAVATYDSEGILRVYSTDFGGSWVPIFDSSVERKGAESFWVFAVSMVSNEVQCIVCADTVEPVVPSGSARPVVTAPPLHLPLISTDDKLLGSEKKMVQARILLSQLDPESNQDLVNECQLNHDKASLSLIKALLEQDKASRAFEAAERMYTSKALEGALRIANHFNIHALVDRIEDLIAARQSAELDPLHSDAPAWMNQNYLSYQGSEPVDDIQDVGTEQAMPLENGEPNMVEAANPFARKAANPFARRKG